MKPVSVTIEESDSPFMPRDKTTFSFEEFENIAMNVANLTPVNGRTMGTEVTVNLDNGHVLTCVLFLGLDSAMGVRDFLANMPNGENELDPSKWEAFVKFLEGVNWGHTH